MVCDGSPPTSAQETKTIPVLGDEAESVGSIGTSNALI
jgi:hypothetical protein